MSHSRAQHSLDVLIVGAGAAGLMCAIEAGNRGRRVAVLDHSPRIGRKILISGGGRCNFTNIHCRPENFLSANPHFARSALARYTPSDFIRLVEKHRIRYHEKTLGQLFCDGSAEEIVNLLLAECDAAGVKIMAATKVHAVRRQEMGDGKSRFLVITAAADFSAPALVIATGGLSIPKIGATNFGFEMARRFGLPVEPCRPALVPLVLSREDQRQFCDLTGVSTQVVASFGKRSFREKLLITHRGLSGPAILQISSYWNGWDGVTVDWAPGQELLASLKAGPARRDLPAAKAALRERLPIRLADRLLDIAAPQSWTNHALGELERQLHHWSFIPAATEGFEKAEVTAGGVSTDALSAQTMECRQIAGLYFVGEVVDVTGHLGGFNFQWAWASGAAAGRAV